MSTCVQCGRGRGDCHTKLGHAFVEPAPQPAPSGDACHCGHPFTGRCKSPAPSSDEAKADYHSRDHFMAALSWIENHHPGGIALVARALSESGK